MGKTITKKKRHHYIPRFYLKGFIDPNNEPYIWVYEKGSSNIAKATSQNIGVQKNFYSFNMPQTDKDSDTLEDLFAELEGLVAPIFQKVKARENINEQERILFALFLAFTMTRVPNFRKNVETVAAEHIKKIIVVYASNAKRFRSLIEKTVCKDEQISAEVLREFALDANRWDVKVKPEFSLAMMGLALDLVPIFNSMKWMFLIATDDYKFVTSDNPLFYFDPTHNPTFLRGVGLLNKNVELTFPISKDLALLGTWENLEGYVQINNNRVKAINRRTVVSAKRFVFSSQKSDGFNNLVQKYKDVAPRMELYGD